MHGIGKFFVKSSLALATLGLGSGALAADQELLDILLGNGAITQTQYDHLLSRDSLSAADLAAPSSVEQVQNPATVLSAPVPSAPVPSDTRLNALEQRVERNEVAVAQATEHASASRWTDTLRVRGYLQTRYSAMLDGDKGINLWPDRSVGDADSLGNADKNLLIRRARLVFQGGVGERLSFYLQPDFAASSGSTGNVLQMRDAYGDFYLTTDRVHRLRIGQSKVPYGFENMQSSSNRLALDRNDALNSGVKDERDLGVFYYYTPTAVQETFDAIAAAGLKSTGNYGMFGFGFYNGQGANRGDKNDNQHAVMRLTYPWRSAGGQFFEAGVQAYTGQYVPSVDAYRGLDNLSHVPGIAPQYANGYDDRRAGVSFVWYPQPFGVQAEWNWGDTPALDFASNSIVQDTLDGGYVQAMYKLDSDRGTFFPFVKWQYFDGANKGEANAPRNQVNDWEVGVEWQLAKEVELTAVWHRMQRTNLVTGNRIGRPDYAEFEADALRLQVQFNY